MKHLSLAARYRPQRFADVAGQPLAAAALSRAAAEDKVAPAYLLSGTRGVGKTTIARIFAKALNCANAPVGEPCNECPQCRHITAGNHVDVSEIDGASNTGVDDVRALRETIGFVPMEGRYKIFIVDEAHMLSKNAFNALLKTLEEPPGHTVFIFATTEAHRFPATIISRCQHFVFRHLPEQAIYDHLVKILGLEGVEYEENAVRLLARRAAGSVRDSLSLLDQALSLGSGRLVAATVRDALGVAGLELFAGLFDSIAKRDCGAVVDLAGSLLASGIDLGFFTRELAAMLRNLFLTRQTEGKILASLANVTEDEKQFLKRQAQAFSAAHLHAAWQMTLESQRGIAQSPEPGAALELLLLNLTLLPRLLPVGSPALKNVAHLVAGEPGEPASKSGNAEEGTPAACAAADETDDRAGYEADWGSFCEFCRSELAAGRDAPPGDLLKPLTVEWRNGVLNLQAPALQLWQRLDKNRSVLAATLSRYCGGKPPQLEIPVPQTATIEKKLPDGCEQKPEIQLCREILGANVTEWTEKQGAGDRNAKHE